MKTIYTLLIILYAVLIRIASPFSIKARQWSQGRKGWRKKCETFDKQEKKVLWIHCASLGEFEQGRPLIEKIRNENQGWKVVLTFFSPSGYEVRKGYSGADLVMYLPSDTPYNAWHFINTIKPDLVLIVKYEFWYNYLNQLRKRNIPTYLVSGIFRPSQYFFRWYGWYARKMFSVFTHIFVQDETSRDLLRGIGFESCTVTGDTRFDRVGQIVSAAKELPAIDSFRGNEPLFVAGSSWDADEDIIIRYINEHPGTMKWLFAPHLIDESHLARIERKLKIPYVRYSMFDDNGNGSRVMIVDNIGMLSSIYRYASIAAVGGGFGKGIHNILEPACWGIPVLFGPNHQNFREAVDLISLGGASAFNDFDDFASIVDKYMTDKEVIRKAGKISSSYVAGNQGATEKVLSIVFKSA